jgi:putative ABC transport system substrate-binding protein
MTTRRQFLLAGALGALSVRYAAAQARAPRVGILAPFPNTILAPLILQRLSELGYRDGAGMQLSLRSVDGIDDRYPKLARELIDAKCDVIFALGSPASRALRDARTPVPVVFLAPDHDPLETGIVDSLRRPQGNITGVYSPAPALAAKRLELALEVLPGARRFLVLADVYSKDQLAALKKAVDARRTQLIVAEYAQPPYDLAGAFDSGRKAGVDAVIGFNSPLWGTNRAALAGLIANHRIPAFVTTTMSSDVGVLVAFGHSNAKLGWRAAELGVQILKGAKPADIPVEQLDEYELVVNLKTAKALGIKIPYSVLARATRVIE